MEQIKKRLGILHSDQSVTVFREDWTIEKARAERAEFDRHEKNPKYLGKIIELSMEFKVIEEGGPVCGPTCPGCGAIVAHAS